MTAVPLHERSSMDLAKRQAIWILCVVCSLGMLLRCLATWSEPMGIAIFSDDNTYINSAVALLNTGSISTERIGLGMPILLGSLFAIFGYDAQGLVASHIVFSFFGILTGIGIYLLGSFLHSRMAGVIAATIAVLEIGLVSTNSIFLTESPYMCLALFAFYFLVRCIFEWKLWRFLMGVFCLCGAVTFKGLALILPLCVICFGIYQKIPWRQCLSKLAIAVVIFCLVFLPWCVCSKKTSGSFSPFPTGQGDQKLLGTYYGIGYPEGTYGDDMLQLDAEAWNNGYQNDRILRLERQKELADQRLAQWMAENPLGFIATHLMVKPLGLLKEAYYPYKLFGVPIRLAQYQWWSLLLLFIGGLVAGRARSQKAAFYMPAVYLFVSSFCTAIYIPISRYNTPSEPFVFLYGAVAIAEAYGMVRRKHSPLTKS